MTAGGFLAVVVLVFGVVRACGGIEPLPDGEKQPEAVSFSEKAAWDERKLGMSKVGGVEFRGDVAVVAGDTGSRSRLAVVDVRTGKPHWVVDDSSLLKGGDGAEAHGLSGMGGVTGKPLVYGEGDDWTVLLQYTKDSQGDETEIGVAALSGKDGTVRWKQPFIQYPDDRTPEQMVRLLAADTRVALTSVETRQGTGPKTVALDPATGRKLWESDGGWAYRFAGDLVLGETQGEGAPPSATWGEQRDGTDVFALDVRSGQKRWDLSKAFDSSHLAAVAGDTAAVNVRVKSPGESYPRGNTVLVDSATGRAGAKLDLLIGCEDDGRTLIACPGTDGQLVTIRPGSGGGPVTTKKPVFDEDTTPWPRLVWQDRIFVDGKAGTDDPVRRAVVDRAGNRLGPAPAGEAIAVSEHAAAFRPEERPRSEVGLVVHAVAVGTEPAEPSGPGGPTVKPPRIDAAPLWTAHADGVLPQGQVKDTGLRSLEAIELAGDAIVYTGREDEDDDAQKLVVADAGTGEERWSLRSGKSLGDGAEADFLSVPHIVEDGEGRLVLVRYSGPGDEQGIAALDLKDGAVRWKQRTSGGDGHTLLGAADDETFAVTVSGYGEDQDETVVYSTKTQKELWRKRGVEPERVGDGLVLAAEYGGDGLLEKGLDVIAYGASDGKRRWRLGDRYPEPELLHDEGGKTIVIGTADGGAVLDRATGRELARTFAPLTRCDGDGDTLIVCAAGADAEAGLAPDSRAVTIQTRDGATRVNDLLETGHLERYGAIGNWFTAILPAVDAAPERFLLLDGEGRRLSDDLPGRPRAIGGGFAVVTPSEIVHGLGGAGVPSFTVHRMTR